MNQRIYRQYLSRSHKLRRSIYNILKDELDDWLIEYALIDSYKLFLEKDILYPFVEKRELKPRARIPDKEYEFQNTFLVIFIEDALTNAHKKYIRFFDDNKVNKTNLLQSISFFLSEEFHRNWRNWESNNFFDLLKGLLPMDYALLIERAPKIKSKNQYRMSHYHVRIDWPIADAAEDLARGLRYISKDLYEKGDRYAEDLQKKFFEYYGLPAMVGGRRTAAIVAAQYLKRLNCISTIYVASSESRALMRFSEQGVNKTILLRIKKDEISKITNNKISNKNFMNNYFIDQNDYEGVCIFNAAYEPTVYSLPPEDGKLRELNPDLFWLSVLSQYIIPKPGVWKYPPLQYNIIYN